MARHSDKLKKKKEIASSGNVNIMADSCESNSGITSGYVANTAALEAVTSSVVNSNNKSGNVTSTAALFEASSNSNSGNVNSTATLENVNNMAAVRRNSGSINSEDSDDTPVVEGYVYSGYLINTAKLEPSMTTLERTTDNVTNTVVFPPDNSKSGNFKSTAEFETNISSNALVTKVEPSKPILNLSSPKDEKTITTFGNNINNHVNLAGDKSIVSPTQSKYDTSRDPMRMMNTCNNNNIPPVSDITTNVQSQRPKPNTNIQPSFLDNQQIPSNVDNYMNEYSLNTSLSPRSNNYVSPLRNTSNFSKYNPRPYYNPHLQRRNNNLHKQTEDMLRKRISILEEENKQLKLNLQKVRNTTIQPSSESPSEKESTKKDSDCTKHPEMYVCVDSSTIQHNMAKLS